MVIGVEIDRASCNYCTACFDYLPGISGKISKEPVNEKVAALFDPREAGKHDMKIGAAIANCPCGCIDPMEVDLRD